MERLQRQRVGLIAADVAGYTRLMEAHEDETHARLMRLTASIVAPCVAGHGGRIVKHTGDGFLAAFGVPGDAARCAIELQRRLGREQSDAVVPIRFRMGVNVADVIVEPHDVFGEGVNLAARLQALAEPGGVVIAESVAAGLRGESGIMLVDLGLLHLKNLERPVHAFGLTVDGFASTLSVAEFAAELAPDPAPRSSIAVLPFRQIPPDPEQAYFAEGIIEGVVHTLSGLEGLFVIASGTMMAFAGRDVDPREVGRELGVRYVLQGRVRRALGRLRISTELSDARDGSVIRTERMEGEQADLFELQDRLAGQVVATIAPAIREQELRRVMRRPPESLGAYDLVLRALDLMPRLDRDRFDQARGFLQRAIAEDPGYPAARSYAALWHLIRIAQGWSPDPAADRVASAAAAAAALEREPSNATALAIRGHYLSYTGRAFAEAAEVLERAVAAGPNNPLAWAFSSATSGYLNDGARAIAHAERAIRLSPLDPFAYLAEHLLSQAHYIVGNFAEAVAWGRRAAARVPLHAANLRTLAASLVAAGETDAARDMALRLLAVDPEFSLNGFAARTPLNGEVLAGFTARLREAGLPD